MDEGDFVANPSKKLRFRGDRIEEIFEDTNVRLKSKNAQHQESPAEAKQKGKNRNLFINLSLIRKFILNNLQTMFLVSLTPPTNLKIIVTCLPSWFFPT